MNTELVVKLLSSSSKEDMYIVISMIENYNDLFEILWIGNIVYYYYRDNYISQHYLDFLSSICEQDGALSLRNLERWDSEIYKNIYSLQ